MLQRIQSFYLVLAVVGIIMLFMFPVATYTMQNPLGNGDVISELRLIPEHSRYSNDSLDIADIHYIGNDLVSFSGSWILAIIAAGIGIISLISIFLFKNRIIQMRVVACAALLNVVYLFLIFFWAINGASGNGGYLKALQELHLTSGDIAVDMWTPGSIIPIVIVVLLYLAQRAIKKDEMKVRAADRLR